MAINSRKISSFPELSELEGDEYLMVAYKGKSYRIKTSLLISNIISNITEVESDKDGGANTITMTLNDNSSYKFTIHNGKKGSTGATGATGKKGPKGDAGVALYNQANIDNLIVNRLDGEGSTEEELAQLILSAAQGVVLNEKLDALKEVYLDSQDDFDELSEKGEITLNQNTKDEKHIVFDSNTKYLIFEE